MRPLSICTVLLLVWVIGLKAQPQKARIMFYNVENLFDPANDSLTNDEDFTPDGKNRWTNTRMYAKLNNTAKVIIAVGEGNMPVLVGLCEIENRIVLNKLVYNTPLKSSHYGVAHFESPDPRGIDVALLYRKNCFKVLTQRALPINFDGEKTAHTRDILYVKGILHQSDTLHVFVNHWPSKYGGVAASLPKRKAVGHILRTFTDSIQQQAKSNIIIMGDLNDTPEDESVATSLGACISKEPCTTNLINLMGPLLSDASIGTHKYGGHWSIIDQFIVSTSLMNNTRGWHIQEAHVYKASFLLKPDKNRSGHTPFRTFLGFKYEGGFSDHLPIYADLIRGN
jgi:exonuclease III